MIQVKHKQEILAINKVYNTLFRCAKILILKFLVSCAVLSHERRYTVTVVERYVYIISFHKCMRNLFDEEVPSHINFDYILTVITAIIQKYRKYFWFELNIRFFLKIIFTLNICM